MSGSDDLVAVEAALHDGVVNGPIELDVITASGPEADEYLHGQLSQNVTSLAVGETRWTLLLQPQGKVDAWMRLHRVDPDRLWLIVDAGFGDDALARLERFKLRVDVTMSLDRKTAMALRGPGTADAVELLDSDVGLVQVDAGWGPVTGVDLLPDGGAPPDPGSKPDFGVAADAEAMELIRILQGLPSMGRELDSSTIPAAAGVVDVSVDFDKGCYLGQELVARVDSRGGNSPRRLRLLVPEEGELVADSPVVTSDGEVGVVTSAVGSLGMGRLKRSAEIGDRVMVGGVAATVTPVPRKTRV